MVLRERLKKATTEYDHAVRQVREEKQHLAVSKRRMVVLLESQDVIQTVAATIQQVVHQRIASVVTRCLQAVFGGEAEFAIRFERARGKTEARLVILRDGNVMTDPMNETGLGEVEVAAFALRVVAVVLSQPARRRLIVADEPFKWVNGEEHQQQVSQIVQQLSRDMGVQFVLVTDDEWLKIGKVIEL